MDEASRRTLEALIFAYAERIDRGDFAGVADLLAHASVALGEGDPVAVGREAVRALYEGSVRLHADGTPRTQHVTTNLVIAGDGDTARARSLFTVFQQLDDLPLQPFRTTHLPGPRGRREPAPPRRSADRLINPARRGLPAASSP